jgi:hypothetical protein
MNVTTALAKDYLVVVNTTPGNQWYTSGNNIYYNYGYVGIGTTTPTTALTVVGTVKATTVNSSYYGAGTNNYMVWFNSAGSTIWLYTNEVVQGTATLGGKNTGHYVSIDTTADVTIPGTLTVTGKTTMGTGGLQVKKGTTTLGGSLTTHQDVADTNGNLTVAGNSTVTGKILKKKLLTGTPLDSSLIKLGKKYHYAIIPTGFTVDTIYIVCTKIVAGSVAVTPKLYYGTDISTTGTAIKTSPASVTSTTTATKIYSFDNATIPAGNMIWYVFTAVTTRPTDMTITIYGH